MSQAFSTALDLVLTQLEGLRRTGQSSLLRVDEGALERLRQTVPAPRSEAAVASAENDSAPVMPARSPKTAAALHAPPAEASEGILFADLDPSPVPLPAGAPSHYAPISDPSFGKAERLAQVGAVAGRCVRCPHLAASRKSVVFGVGNPDAEVMFVGEAPGADEDAQGEPFVGRAGQLLNKILQTMGCPRESVYIANVLKCRPDTPGQKFGNRPPTVGEMETCLPYLREQVEIIRPRAIVALGATAVRGLLGLERPMRELRGRWHDFRGTPVMVTYHPAYLLRNPAPSEKRKTWEDLLLVKEKLGHEITARDRGYFLTAAA